MSLTEYRRKRQFGKTREPEPGKRLPPGQRAIFVVQLHHASRRHYDFRLQVGDALKSWAVPKGPSYDPKVKRMAVEVEDHPVDYAGFEGEIPKGQYGGGHVALFDRGVWATEGDAEAQLAKGHLRFELFGDKLKGAWHLVRSGKAARQPQWLLFKADDGFAGSLEADDLLADVTAPPAADARRAGTGKPAKKRRAGVAPNARRRKRDWSKPAAKLPGARKARAPEGAFVPQLARLGQAPPQGAQWVHELKWDGYRILATVAQGEVRLWSRNALEWTDKLPEIRAAVEQLRLASAALDGELIAGQGGREDFGLLQATLSGEKQGALAYVLFDLLHLDGIDLSDAPLLERKALLQQVLGKPPPPHLAFSSHIEGDGAAAHALAAERRFEGIISKRGDRPYHPGRGDEWRKTKQLLSDEYAVVGYTAPKGRRSGFGSLLLARPDPEHGWIYSGRVGTGFSEQLIAELSERIGKAGRSEPTVHVPPHDTDLRSAKWFAPRFVVEVFARGTGSQGLLRQPSLKAVRADKEVAELADSDRGDGRGPARRSPRTSARGGAGSAKRAKRSKAAAPAAAPSAAAPRAAPRLSSPDKLIFPDIRATKQDVADYYLAVMEHLLPGIAGRPLSIIRCPGGAEKPCFFQKHHTAGLELVSFARLKEEAGNNANYLVVEDAAGLMELVQFNALEFHPWGARADAPELADRVVFDLDPGPGVPFAEVKRAATHVRKLLAQLELESFLRATGGKGLHVVVPLNPGCEWGLVKRFAHGFADALARSEPTRFISVSTLKLRPKKIFVDYLRNSRGATSVASYSLRARAGAPVALPIGWNELSRLERGDAFTLENVPARLKRRRKDPWAEIDRVKQNLARWSSED
ncbi:DNA ligase D [Luteimonas sp. RD2P54]|uniref:DNA ligase (ATP) n=1 Tax=Luteimonas endophytica TaxID=3042023 RepID=A0ABT6JAV5_9GAMM|nr:DNA ligase D [Luteimonas endophytica]MDH5823962.1 DNA ligase D [Luteimonas endophytica]